MIADELYPRRGVTANSENRLRRPPEFGSGQLPRSAERVSSRNQWLPRESCCPNRRVVNVIQILNSQIELHCFALTRLSFSWLKETPRRTKQCTGKLPLFGAET